MQAWGCGAGRGDGEGSQKGGGDSGEAGVWGAQGGGTGCSPQWCRARPRLPTGLVCGQGLQGGGAEVFQLVQ